jgi:hypothetical protein
MRILSERRCRFEPGRRKRLPHLSLQEELHLFFDAGTYLAITQEAIDHGGQFAFHDDIVIPRYA